MAFLVFAGCALERTEPDSSDVIGLPGGIVGELDPALEAEAFYGNPDCDRALLSFEGALYRNGMAIADAECFWRFGDGGTETGCVGTHEFPPYRETTITTAELIARDPATGGIAIRRQTFPVYPAFTADLIVDSPACQTIAFRTEINPPSFRVVFVQPEVNVVGDAFSNFGEGSFRVTVGGVYEVNLFAEDERGSAGPICSRNVRKLVTVEDCEQPPHPDCKPAAH